MNRDFQDTILELKPSFYIDFTKKYCFQYILKVYHLRNMFQKDSMVDRVISHNIFLLQIDRYWHINGVNMIVELFKIEMKEFKGEIIDE